MKDEQEKLAYLYCALEDLIEDISNTGDELYLAEIVGVLNCLAHDYQHKVEKHKFNIEDRSGDVIPDSLDD